MGASATRTSFGFRSAPYASQVGARVLYGVDAGSAALQLFGDWRPPMSSLALQLDVLASGMESQRFYGFGNESRLLPQDSALILRNELRIEPTIRWFFGDNTSVHAGPVGRFVDAREADGIRAAGVPATAFDSYGAVGGRIGLTHDRVLNPSKGGSGYRASAEAATFRGIDDGDESFSRATGEVAAFIPLRWPTLALRAGGEHAWGSFPLHEAPQIGGRQTLRGFRWNRFTGDAVAFGNAELRVPITRAEFLVRGDLGLIIFADAGRAWVDGESAGGWHTSNGVGISFAALSNAVSVLYARGEENRVYLNLGFPF